MMEVIRKPVEDLVPADYNPRKISAEAMEGLKASLKNFGLVQPIVWNEHTGNIVGGHQRLIALIDLGESETDVVVVNLEEEEEKALNVTLNNQAIQGEWDVDKLSDLIDELRDSIDFFEDVKLDNLEISCLEDIDVAEELNQGQEGECEDSKSGDLKENNNIINESAFVQVEDFVAKKGDVWILGEHKISCSDCCDVDNVKKLMAGGSPCLLIADPPYGIGKGEIENDNIYNEKLNDFNIKWSSAAIDVMNSDSSYYIFGYPVVLFRLWFSFFEPLGVYFKNEIVWDKKSAIGIRSPSNRCYPVRTERALFFQSGLQNYSSNADNYFEKFEPIRLYLLDSRKKMGWSVQDMKKAAGHKDLNRDHWTSKSQWEMPTEKVYNLFRDSAYSIGVDAFCKEYDEIKKEYDEIKKEFLDKRCFFDNCHESMTDIWEFSSPTGDERFGHDSPKPVEIFNRIIKSSSVEGDIVYDPFLGTGPTLLSCELLNRVCYGFEINPKYCDVVISRWQNFTGLDAVLQGSGETFNSIKGVKNEHC